MSLKKWLQKNQVFDKDLLKLFPKYGVNDPEKDLKNLTTDQWNEIQATIKNGRAKELKDNAAKIRLQKKLTKIEKLWRTKRPKKKKKSPKLLPIFADDTAPPINDNVDTGSPTKKGKKKGNKQSKKDKPKSPKKKSKQKDKDKDKNKNKNKDKDKNEDKNKDNNNNNDNNKADSTQTSKDNNDKSTESKTNDNNTERKEDWDHYDDLKLSDNEEESASINNGNNTGYTMPTLQAQGSVVDMLLNGPNQPHQPYDTNTNEHKQQSEETKENAIDIETVETKEDNDETWDRYDDLRISDDEEDDNKQKEPSPSPGSGLFVPLVPLKTQGSVVDMLMDGPFAHKQQKVVTKGITVTPPPPSDNIKENGGDIQKEYSITVTDDTKNDQDDKKENGNKGFVKTAEATRIAVDEDDTMTVTYYKADGKEKKEEEKRQRVMVCLNADSFVYNESADLYTVSLSKCRLMRSDFISGQLTFTIKGSLVDKNKSDEAEKHMDDKYIQTVLDEIERDNPDSDKDD